MRRNRRARRSRKMPRKHRRKPAARDRTPAVLARCEELRQETTASSTSAPAPPTPSIPRGLVKGWSVGRAAAIADAIGWRNYAIIAGATSASAAAHCPRHRGGSGSSTRSSGSRSSPSSWATISPSRPRAPMRAARTCSTRTRAVRLRRTVGDDHRPRPRNCRRVRDRGVRHGRPRARLDRSTSRLRGDDVERRRPLVPHARVFQTPLPSRAAICVAKSICVGSQALWRLASKPRDNSIVATGARRTLPRRRTVQQPRRCQAWSRVRDESVEAMCPNAPNRR